ncbi:hypothetical protein L208DRAFT_1250180 [Tricholoma matsutake]|nr:hypothetical protein L208DRAFT_1250180 [Tricholoma matsutake 945]
MACTAANKAEKPQIPEINWSANNSLAVCALLAEIKKNENYRILYGRKDVRSFLSSFEGIIDDEGAQLYHRLDI